jgi:hypothetical protein
MLRSLIIIVSLCISLEARAQVGCSDAGVCSIGGHSTETTHSVFEARVTPAFSFNHDYTYLDLLGSMSYDFEIAKVEASLNYRNSRARYDPPATYKLNNDIPGGKQPPKVQHVTIATNKIMDHRALGDAKLSLTVPLDVVRSGVSLHAGYSIPTTDLYPDRPQDMQSTLGLDALILGVSYDTKPDEISYGGTIGYYTTFNEQNSLHLTRADDIAAAFRLSGPVGMFTAGADISAIYHFADDKLHGTPTSSVVDLESTKGLTVNLGGSLNYYSPGPLSSGLFFAAPVIGIAHVDGLKRSLVLGVYFSYTPD